VFGIVLKPADPSALRNELAANFTPLLFDVTDETAVAGAEPGPRRAQRRNPGGVLVKQCGIAVATRA